MEVQQSASKELTNDLEIIQKKEDEHLRLQRQFRMIQADRKNRTMGVHPVFRRQDNLLKTLKKDYVNVAMDLKVARSGVNRNKEERTKKEVKKAILKREETDTQCENGIILMKQLDGLLQRNHKQTLRLKYLVNSSMGKLNERRVTSDNRLMATENKLEAAMLRFNAVQSENKKIREEIEHVLKERAIFNQAWDKMLNALTKGKKFLTDLFESSTLAYDQRDEWCTKLKSVQEKGKMDQQLQVQEMRDLQKLFDHEMKLHNFISKKGVKRINLKEEKRVEEQKIAKEKYFKEQYEAHSKILDDINEYTQEWNANKIIDTFQHREQKNFAVYKMLTEYCAENEVLSRDLQRIRRCINIVWIRFSRIFTPPVYALRMGQRQQLQEMNTTFIKPLVKRDDRKDFIEMIEEKQIKKLNVLKDELEQRRRNTENVRRKLDCQTQVLNDAMKKVDEIFKMLDCSLEPFHNLLGDKQPSFHSLNLTCCLISEKIKELVQTAFYYERHIQKRVGTSRLKNYTVHPEPPKFWTSVPINYLVPADPCPSCVEARWMSRVLPDKLEMPLEEDEVGSAIAELANDPAFVRSDRIHPLTECRVARSRVILARRYMQN